MEANKILSANVLDLIFEDRNKDYGAYELRKTYNRRIARAISITASIALLALLGSVWANNINKKKDTKVLLTSVDLSDIKQNDKKEIIPPLPPPKQVPPRVEMRQFTPPVIKEDDELHNPPPAQDDLINVKISDINQDGIKDPGIADPVNIDDGKKIIEEKKVDADDLIHTTVDVEAGLPEKWHQYLERNCNGQVASENNAPEGRYGVIVQFVVDKEGNISEATALTNYGYGMEEEAIRAIKKGPKWRPAISGGYPVKAYRKQQITFEVTGN